MPIYYVYGTRKIVEDVCYEIEAETPEQAEDLVLYGGGTEIWSEPATKHSEYVELTEVDVAPHWL